MTPAARPAQCSTSERVMQYRAREYEPNTHEQPPIVRCPFFRSRMIREETVLLMNGGVR